MTKEERLEKQKKQLFEMRTFDNEYRRAYGQIGGIDEVGRGPLCGPVVACCVVLPENIEILGINDSKKLSKTAREKLYDQILEEALAVGIGQRDNKVIDEINILEATKQAMVESIDKAQKMLQKRNLRLLDHVLIDAVTLNGISQSQNGIVKGDTKSLSIAAASIVAKVTRDRIMEAYAEQYPGYGFESNMGYGTEKHYEGLRKYGITPIHRLSFLKSFMGNE
ncbi:MAG: ribonuclease HII [Firmicutes bacterium]|nr:ribonuclease HII [Bacillota bacterium]